MLTTPHLLIAALILGMVYGVEMTRYKIFNPAWGAHALTALAYFCTAIYLSFGHHYPSAPLARTFLCVGLIGQITALFFYRQQVYLK